VRDDCGRSDRDRAATGMTTRAASTGAPRADAVRPDLVASIAGWWHGHLCADGAGSNLPTAVLIEVSERFGCSNEEAIRGICVGEQLYWGGA